MKSLFEQVWEDAESFANSKDPNDRIFGASVMKELHEIGSQLIQSQTPTDQTEEIKKVQERIKERIEAI